MSSHPSQPLGIEPFFILAKVDFIVLYQLSQSILASSGLHFGQPSKFNPQAASQVLVPHQVLQFFSDAILLPVKWKPALSHDHGHELPSKLL